MDAPKEYTVHSFKAGDFQDPNGNTWCEVLFEEWRSEPLKWVVKDPTTITEGMKVYGHIETKTSKANKPYQRFYRDQRPEAGTTTPLIPEKQASGSTWQGRDDAAIRAQWAIGQAMTYALNGKQPTLDSIERNATKLFQMVDRVKVASATQNASQRVSDTIPSEADDFQRDLEAGFRADGINPEDFA